MPKFDYELCGKWMPYKKTTCARASGHLYGCLTAESMSGRRKKERVYYRKVVQKPVRNYQRGTLTRHERRLFIGLLKQAHGCADCGYREHPEALQFDHLPGNTKIHDVNKMVKYNTSNLFNEIAKCEVVCANCHAIRTAKRRSAQLS